LLLTHW